jgi:DNA (cytosine-5)-methyltransferase 1
MIYGSLFSGIEAASLAFEKLNWTPAWFAEIDKFAKKVLQHRWPTVPNLGDVMTAEFTKVDLIIGGSPCQSFSSSGKRAGLNDQRGQLTLKFFDIIRNIKPTWFIWENVPAVLNYDEVMDEVCNCGYGVAWRVLDTRCWGLPQSRRRLYVVGRLGESCPPEILFEPSDLQNFNQKHSRPPKVHLPVDVVPIALRGHHMPSGPMKTALETMDCFGTLRATPGFGRSYVWDGRQVRKLTPRECEWLMGMSGEHTAILSDNQRYKTIGNSMVVPVLSWVGKRIDKMTPAW